LCLWSNDCGNPFDIRRYFEQSRINKPDSIPPLTPEEQKHRPAKHKSSMKSPEQFVEEKEGILCDATVAAPGEAAKVYPLETRVAVLLICFYLLVFIVVARVGSTFLPRPGNHEPNLLLLQDIAFISVQFPWARGLLGLRDVFDTASGENRDLIATAFFAISLSFISLGMLMVDWSFQGSPEECVMLSNW